MSEKEKVLSIGIDVGTSTLQFVLSRLTVENTASLSVLPQYEISKKEIMYRSPVCFTPKKGENELDGKKIREIIAAEFEQSGYRKEQVETGAIIVTGEAANKENADQVTRELSEFAGEFVVAVAGCDLEASLAGYGSGAAEMADTQGKKILNLDIGGGTTNCAFFDGNELKDLYGMHIGGRLIRTDDDGKIDYVSDKLTRLFRERGISIRVGQKAEKRVIDAVCVLLAETLAAVVKNQPLSEGQKSLRIYHGAKGLIPDEVTISGGVGELIGDAEASFSKQINQFHDIGPRLAYWIKKTFKENGILYRDCSEHLQATVIGAGMHSMQLSGSTICYDEELLPLKNIPIVSLRDCRDICSIEAYMKKEAQKHTEMVAFYLPQIRKPDYKAIKTMAGQIWNYYQGTDYPILFLFEEDIAKVMGQTLRICSKRGRKIICIDSVKVRNGDYIDFCRVLGGTMLITIKTLLFKN